jgi:hypothetical protein
LDKDISCTYLLLVPTARGPIDGLLATESDSHTTKMFKTREKGEWRVYRFAPHHSVMFENYKVWRGLYHHIIDL